LTKENQNIYTVWMSVLVSVNTHSRDIPPFFTRIVTLPCCRINHKYLIIVFSIQHVGLRRGDIVVALKLCAGDGSGRALDVRWETCRRVAELIVNHHHHHQRRRKPSSGDGAVVHLKIITPITPVAASDGYPSMDPNKVPKISY